jgi:carbon-monoxide dehydrogenase large subunit
VEVDKETGQTTIIAYTVVDDFGVVVNPMIVEGQIHGGVSHGVGQALLEEVSYDAEGQLLAGTFMDYTMPRAQDVPTPALGFTTTPCPHNPLGVKGCGEAGAIAAPPAVMNAVTDALQDYDTSGLSMPATSEKVWRVINGGRAAAAE